MKCLKCDCEKFKEKNVHFNPEVKGEEVKVAIPVWVCTACATPWVDSTAMNRLRRAAANRYRHERGLLTAEQIRMFREALGMSQATFARYLHIGEASIKRWETYYVQDAGQDEHIRLKCDAAYAEQNFLDICWKKQVPSEFSGNRWFSLQHFKNVALYLVSKTEESILILNKLHFFIDFLHCKRTGESLTGVRYIPLKYGPCPDQYKTLYDCLEKAGAIEEVKPNHYRAKSEPDLSLFDNEELETLEQFTKIYNKKGGDFLYNLSHKEKGFEETTECDYISYDYAKDLLL